MIILQIAERIKQNGGCALIADYGHDGDKTDTLRVSGYLYKSILGTKSDYNLIRLLFFIILGLLQLYEIK